MNILEKQNFLIFQKSFWKSGAGNFNSPVAIILADIARKYGFTDISYRLYNRTRDFSAKEYTELLGTYSDHIALPENVRQEFYAKVEKTINDFGGMITIYDTIDLQLARKP